LSKKCGPDILSRTFYKGRIKLKSVNKITSLVFLFSLSPLMSLRPVKYLMIINANSLVNFHPKIKVNLWFVGEAIYKHELKNKATGWLDLEFEHMTSVFLRTSALAV
jgi:hypothetical protein